MELNQAKAIAERVVEVLRPFCDRIQIAGSIRREKLEVKNIEVVWIPTRRELINFCQAVDKWPKIKGQPFGKYTQRQLPGIKLDLFMAHKDNYGGIMLIRTGDWEFSKKFMGTILPCHRYKYQDGFLTRDGIVIPILNEEALFELCSIEYIEPFQRTKDAL
jgi:DNA polymerase/3'-5' exonuclease PolX